MSKAYAVKNTVLPVLPSTQAIAEMPVAGVQSNDKDHSVMHNAYQATKRFALFITRL